MSNLMKIGLAVLEISYENKWIERHCEEIEEYQKIN
jgi:hypothetical protein